LFKFSIYPEKFLYLFIAAVLIIFVSCSSSPRFTKKSTQKPVERTGDSLDEYSNSAAVESFTGIASYYAHEFHGRQTANGEIYDMNGLTAAHPTFPFETIIRVTNLKNNKSVIIRINDRMPKHPERIIDLSLGTAEELDMITDGLAEVRLDILKWGE
jgi:rare lipoprotein A